MNERRVLVIQPPADFTGQRKAMPTGYSGVGALSIVAWLRHRGHQARFLNLGNETVPTSNRVSLLRNALLERPDVVAVGLNWVHVSVGAIQTARIARKLCPRATIVLGGQHAGMFADEVASDYRGDVDVVIVGEAERALSDIVEAGWTRGPAVVMAGFPVEDVDSLPFYDYRLVEPGEEHVLSALSTLRGRCPRTCLYCMESWGMSAIGRGSVRPHSTEWLAGQTSTFASTGRRTITIQDPFFLFGDRPLSALSAALNSSGVALDEFNLFVEPDSYGEDGFRALGAMPASLVSADLGVESGSDRVLRLSGRRYTGAEVMRDIESLIAAGVVPYTWWMVGLPGETEEDVNLTRKLLVQTMAAGAAPRWVTPMVLFPGSGAYARFDRLGIRPRMHKFSDMLVFSEQQFSPDGVYPSLVTHDLDGLSGDRVLALTLELKALIRDRWHDMVRRHRANPATARHSDLLARMCGEGGDEFELSTFF